MCFIQALNKQSRNCVQKYLLRSTDSSPCIQVSTQQMVPGSGLFHISAASSVSLPPEKPLALTECSESAFSVCWKTLRPTHKYSHRHKKSGHKVWHTDACYMLFLLTVFQFQKDCSELAAFPTWWYSAGYTAPSDSRHEHTVRQCGKVFGPESNNFALQEVCLQGLLLLIPDHDCSPTLLNFSTFSWTEENVNHTENSAQAWRSQGSRCMASTFVTHLSKCWKELLRVHFAQSITYHK